MFICLECGQHLKNDECPYTDRYRKNGKAFMWCRTCINGTPEKKKLQK